MASDGDVPSRDINPQHRQMMDALASLQAAVNAAAHATSLDALRTRADALSALLPLDVHAWRLLLPTSGGDAHVLPTSNTFATSTDYPPDTWVHELCLSFAAAMHSLAYGMYFGVSDEQVHQVLCTTMSVVADSLSFLLLALPVPLQQWPYDMLFHCLDIALHVSHNTPRDITASIAALSSLAFCTTVVTAVAHTQHGSRASAIDAVDGKRTVNILCRTLRDGTSSAPFAEAVTLVMCNVASRIASQQGVSPEDVHEDMLVQFVGSLCAMLHENVRNAVVVAAISRTICAAIISNSSTSVHVARGGEVCVLVNALYEHRHASDTIQWVSQALRYTVVHNAAAVAHALDDGCVQLLLEVLSLYVSHSNQPGIRMQLLDVVGVLIDQLWDVKDVRGVLNRLVTSTLSATEANDRLDEARPEATVRVAPPAVALERLDVMFAVELSRPTRDREHFFWAISTMLPNAAVLFQAPNATIYVGAHDDEALALQLRNANGLSDEGIHIVRDTRISSSPTEADVERAVSDTSGETLRQLAIHETRRMLPFASIEMWREASTSATVVRAAVSPDEFLRAKVVMHAINKRLRSVAIPLIQVQRHPLMRVPARPASVYVQQQAGTIQPVKPAVERAAISAAEVVMDIGILDASSAPPKPEATGDGWRGSTAGAYVRTMTGAVFVVTTAHGIALESRDGAPAVSEAYLGRDLRTVRSMRCELHEDATKVCSTGVCETACLAVRSAEVRLGFSINVRGIHGVEPAFAPRPFSRAFFYRGVSDGVLPVGPSLGLVFRDPASCAADVCACQLDTSMADVDNLEAWQMAGAGTLTYQHHARIPEWTNISGSPLLCRGSMTECTLECCGVVERRVHRNLLTVTYLAKPYELTSARAAVRWCGAGEHPVPHPVHGDSGAPVCMQDGSLHSFVEGACSTVHAHHEYFDLVPAHFAFAQIRELLEAAGYEMDGGFYRPTDDAAGSEERASCTAAVAPVPPALDVAVAAAPPLAHADPPRDDDHASEPPSWVPMPTGVPLPCCCCAIM